MSVFGASSWVLTLRPSIVRSRDRLVIQSGWLSRLMVSFLFNRRIEIFFNQRLVAYRNIRFLIFRRTRMIGFNELSHIDYTYGSTGRSWGWRGSGIGRQDLVESFSISLITKQKERINVCAFWGEGGVGTGWVGAIFGGHLIDARGTQEEESRELVCYLNERMGLPIGEPLEMFEYAAACRACGRRISKLSRKCLYCGSTGQPAQPMEVRHEENGNFGL